MSLTMPKQDSPVCPECHAKYTVKKGKRRNRLQTIPLFQCNECQHRFSGAPGKHKSYPLKAILDGISTFNLGYSLSETQRILRQRAHFDIPERTIRSWLGAYRPLTTYSRLRSAGRKLFDPRTITRSVTFNHQQVYRFQVHQAKLELLLRPQAHQHLSPIRDYVGRVQQDFPNHLFEVTAHRSSKFLPRFSRRSPGRKITRRAWRRWHYRLPRPTNSVTKRCSASCSSTTP